MIYVNQKQLDQVEYILEQSARGHHVLFDIDDIRRAFGEFFTFEEEEEEVLLDEVEVAEAEKHIENLILQPTLLSKKTYLENLTPEMYDNVVRTYFTIVENNIFEGSEFRH